MLNFLFLCFSIPTLYTIIIPYFKAIQIQLLRFLKATSDLIFLRRYYQILELHLNDVYQPTIISNNTALTLQKSYASSPDKLFIRL